MPKFSDTLTTIKTGDSRMNKAAITKHEIYNNLAGFTDKDLDAIADFVDFMRHQKNLKNKKLLKFQGILKDYVIDFVDLKQFKDQAWQHVEQEFGDA